MLLLTKLTNSSCSLKKDIYTRVQDTKLSAYRTKSRIIPKPFHFNPIDLSRYHQTRQTSTHKKKLLLSILMSRPLSFAHSILPLQLCFKVSQLNPICSYAGHEFFNIIKISFYSYFSTFDYIQIIAVGHARAAFDYYVNFNN